MKRVYVHNQQGSYKSSRSTIAVDIPEDFLDKVKLDIGSKERTSIPISIGVAKCHPIDAYVKSIGRGISGSRMEYVWFVVDNILFKDDRVCLTLSASDEVYQYFMRAHVYRDSGNIRIIECHADLDTFN